MCMRGPAEMVIQILPKAPEPTDQSGMVSESPFLYNEKREVLVLFRQGLCTPCYAICYSCSLSDKDSFSLRIVLVKPPVFSSTLG
jgi:hypothetical protein